MFQISPDQTQWFHLNRVKRLSPITFVLLAREEVKFEEGSAQVFDFRVLSNDETMIGNSWCLRSTESDTRAHSRSDCMKFLELYAKFSIAALRNRGFDEIEFNDSSREELTMAAMQDEKFRRNLESVVPTLYPKIARTLLEGAVVNEAWLQYQELNDWPTRVPDATA